MATHIKRGNCCHLRVGGKRIPAEVVDVREQLIRLRCPEDGVPTRGSGLTIEFAENGAVAGYFAQVLTAAPGQAREVVLLRSPGLDRIDLRSFLRVPSSFTATVEGVQTGGPAEAQILNISSGGALLRTPARVQVGEPVRVTLTAVEQRPIHISGSVVHIGDEQPQTEHSIGVRFLGVDTDGRHAISWYVWKRIEQIFSAPA
ncbi:MAG: PilZ domain-containing protein [Candidatus Hydrogenedentes bacterium]|nr:PilZ domain-containing protein [Candidatus Hydrogenedentota bacterium]